MFKPICVFVIFQCKDEEEQEEEEIKNEQQQTSQPPSLCSTSFLLIAFAFTRGCHSTTKAFIFAKRLYITLRNHAAVLQFHGYISCYDTLSLPFSVIPVAYFSREERKKKKKSKKCNSTGF